MTRQRLWLAGSLVGVLALGLVPKAGAQGQLPAAGPPIATDAGGLDVKLLRILEANPVTAPYRYATTLRGGKVVLIGRVGTKQVHDAAIQLAIDSGIPIQDELVIDTAAAYAVAAAANAPPVGPVAPFAGAPGYGPVAGPVVRPAFPGAGGAFGGSSAYVYPPPLFGFYDDPFFGFQPPIISYPPWWGAMSAHRFRQDAMLDAQAPAPGVGAAPAPASPGAPVAPNTVVMDIDPLGIAVLRGTVPTLDDRLAIERKIAQMPGVAEVVNRLDVREADPNAPPPPPEPAAANPPINPDLVPAPAPAPIAGNPPPVAPRADGADVAGRLSRAIAQRPALAGSPIQATVRDGLAQLSGKVPTAFEAMIAYRAAQQTPGVRAIDDRLEFAVPDGQGKNPLLEKGRPEDIEPYLEAQVRRQVGDQASIDRVRLQGDTLEIRGTVAQTDDIPRVEAILRSMALLRGFQVNPKINAE